jgi:large subunit ribosomal protein L25
MPVELKLNAENRADLGKGASRRLRRAKKVPAVLYGGHQDAVSLQLDMLQLDRLMKEEAFYSQILTLDINGKAESAQVKALQRHPVKPLVLHVDLQRVVAGELMHSHVPLHFLGEEAAVKATGGVIHHDMIEVEVECLPRDLPQYIEVDVTSLTPGGSIHLSELKLPQGVTIPALAQGADHDLPVVSMSAPRVAAEGTGAGEAGEAAGE